MYAWCNCDQRHAVTLHHLWVILIKIHLFILRMDEMYHLNASIVLGGLNCHWYRTL